MITLLLAIALGFVLLAEFIDGSTNKFGFLAVVPGVLGTVFAIIFGVRFPRTEKNEVEAC